MIKDLYGHMKKDSLVLSDGQGGLEDTVYSNLGKISHELSESFKSLNSYQKEAVVSSERALIVNACVGSGKTTVLVHKVLYLHYVKKIKLSDMVVLTFTNKAAEEIKERVLSCGEFAIDRKDLCLFGTFHSVANYLMSNRLPVEDLGYTKEYSIIDENGIQEMFDSIIEGHNLNIKYRKKLEKRLDDYKRGKKLYGSMKYHDEIDRFIDMFREEKLRRNVMDYDDLIVNCSELLKRGSFNPSWVIIDEFQDTDGSQLDMLDGLAGKGTHVFAVGDPNQIIYTWRGSRPDIFDLFKERYDAKEATLPINYRSSTAILEAARAMLDNPASLEGMRGRGAPVIIKKHYNSFNEALYLADRVKKLHMEGARYRDIAVFYRKQKQSEVFEDVFEREAIPYEVSVRKNLKDIPSLYWFVRLIKTALNSRDTESIRYVLADRRYGCGLSHKEVSRLLKESNEEEKAPELLSKITGFREWCRCLESLNGLEELIYKYFDLDKYLSPTSISYDEDKGIILKYIRELREYIDKNRCEVLEGVKRASEYSILYGSQVINQMVDPERESVKLMTLHASKGLEFKYVFISGANWGIIPMGGRVDNEEEKRLFFVGITRAKDHLEISYHSNPEDYNVLSSPSPYLRLIPDEIIESDEIKSRRHKLSELRKEIKANMEQKQQDNEDEGARVKHEKYGEGRVIAEDDDTITVRFEGYGEKSFSRLFCPLKFIDNE